MGAKPLSKEQIKKLGEGGFDQSTLRKRLGVTEEYQLQSNEAGGRNFKSIHDKLAIKETMKIGSEVIVLSGTHEGMEGKIIAVSASADAKSLQQKIMGDKHLNDTEIEDDAYVSLELKINNSIVNIKRKRLILKNHKAIYMNESKPKRSRSRSLDKRPSPSKDQKKSKEDNKKKLKWVIPNLIIRVVSKKVAEGKLYNKKLRVADVLSAYQFLAVPIEGGSASMMYDDLREKDIETIIPKEDHA